MRFVILAALLLTGCGVQVNTADVLGTFDAIKKADCNRDGLISKAELSRIEYRKGAHWDHVLNGQAEYEYRVGLPNHVEVMVLFEKLGAQELKINGCN